MTAESRTANVIDQRLGARVRMRRIEIGMSQERLGELLGVTFQQVQKYEKGVNRIAASRLLDISVALDMSVCDFFEGLSGAPGARSGARADAPQGSVELMGLFATIESLKVRRRVLDLVRAMAEAAD